MIVYHGSNSNFKKLRIAKELVQRESTKTNEGMGIYFSTDKETARGYGKYLYTIEINKAYFYDFRKRITCKGYVHKIVTTILRETGVDITKYYNIDETVDRLYFGGLAFSGVGRELYLILDNTTEFYMLPNSKREKIYRILRAFDRKPPKAYMFNYHIKNIGVIKDVSEDVVRIISKEQSY